MDTCQQSAFPEVIYGGLAGLKSREMGQGKGKEMSQGLAQAGNAMCRNTKTGVVDGTGKERHPLGVCQS